MRSFSKRVSLSAIVLVVACAVSFAGGTPDTASQDETEVVTLKFTFWGGPGEKEAMENAVADFEATYPNIEVDAIHIATDFETKLATMIAGRDAPDVSYMSGLSGFKYAEQGLFTNVLDLIENDPDLGQGDYLDLWYFWEPGKAMGPLVAVVNTVLMYNKDLFEEAGVEHPPTRAEEAWTWDEFVDVAKTLTIDAAGNNAHSADFDPENIAQYGIDWGPWWFVWMPMVWQNGGDWISEDGTEFGLTEPEALEAIQSVADLINVHHVAPNPAQQSALPSPSAALLSRKVAMVVNGHWNTLDVGNAGFNWDVGVLPRIDSRRPSMTMAFGGVTVIFSSTEHPDEAWLLHKWINNPASVLEMHQGLWMPQRTSWYTDQELLAQWTTGPSRPEGYMEAVVNPVFDVATNPAYKPAEFYVRNFPEQHALIAPAIERVWNGEATAEEALSDIEDDLRPLIAGWYHK